MVAQAALQHDGTAAFAERFEENEVLHVARADLQDVGVFRDEIDVAIAHDFGDDAEAGGVSRLLQELQAVLFQALEIVGRGARLERAAAEELGAGLATASAASMICFSLSTEHGPAMTMNSSPPISTPLLSAMRVRPDLNCLLTNLYGAEMRTTFSTCGMDSTDSMQAVTSPTPTTPITTRSSPSIECTL